jgi:glycine/D-amino acid oxidase-like deaminating enzyme
MDTKPRATEPLPPSIYAEMAAPAPSVPRLEGEARFDVAVVGGGFTGLSTALHLAMRGVKAAVLEAREIGWGASGRNGGQVNPGLKWEPERIEADFGRALSGRMVRLSGAAPDLVFRLIREHQIQCEANQGGTIRAAFSAKGAETIRQTADAWQARAMPTRYLDREAIRQATGTLRYRNGVIDRRGGSVNPLGYARGLADAALKAGATIYRDSLAIRIDRSGADWRVTTPSGSVHANWVVLATNGYTDDLWPKLRRSIVPVFSGIVASEPLGPGLAEKILPDRPVVYESGSLTVYYRRDEQNRILIGGRSRLSSAEGADAFRELARYAERLWPAICGVRWTHGWNGQLAVATDAYPHLHEPAPNVIAALGYNGRGVAMATAMGNEIARRVTGTPAADLDMPVTDLRAIPFHGIWRTAAAARIAYGRVRDALNL